MRSDAFHPGLKDSVTVQDQRRPTVGFTITCRHIFFYRTPSGRHWRQCIGASRRALLRVRRGILPSYILVGIDSIGVNDLDTEILPNSRKSNICMSKDDKISVRKNAGTTTKKRVVTQNTSVQVQQQKYIADGDYCSRRLSASARLTMLMNSPGGRGQNVF